jgi:DNA-binding CsgD family transcriptional regulator
MPASIDSAKKAVLLKIRQTLSFARNHYEPIIFALALIIFIALFTIPGPMDAVSTCTQGAVDFSRQDQPIIPLAGEWKMETNPDVTTGKSFEFAVLPREWKNPYGTATYRLRVTGLDPECPYALRIPYMSSSFILKLDDGEIYRNGEAGLTRETTKPGYMPGVVTVPRGRTGFDLTLFVSNFHHRRGGPFQTILLGSESDVRHFDFWNLFFDGIVTVVFIFIGGLFIFNAMVRRVTMSLFIGFFYMFIGLTIFVDTPEVLVLRVFPRLDWTIYIKLDYLITYLLPLLALLATVRLFGGLSPRGVGMLTVPLGIIYAAILVTTPAFFTRINVVFQVYFLFICALVFAICMRGVIKRYPYAKTITIGFVIFFGMVLSGALYANNKIRHGQYLPLSFISSLFNLSWISHCILDFVSYACMIVLANVFSVLFFLKSPDLVPSRRPSDGESEAVNLREKGIAAGLSSREMEITTLVLQGKRNVDICDELCISMSTVKTHLSRVFKKTCVQSRSELFFYFHR